MRLLVMLVPVPLMAVGAYGGWLWYCLSWPGNYVGAGNILVHGSGFKGGGKS